MRQSVLISVLGAAALVSGCATKNYVRQNVQPLQMKLDQVADQTNKQGTELDQTRQDVAKNTAAISATDEKATAADRRAGDAPRIPRIRPTRRPIRTLRRSRNSAG